MGRDYITKYLEIPVMHRRIALVFLVPAMWFFFLDISRKIMIVVGKFLHSHGLDLLIIPLLIAVLFIAILHATVIGLFAYEFFIGIGNRIKNKLGGALFGLLVLFWILVPLYFL